MFNFFLKNMPGSPGSTAKTIINKFNQNNSFDRSLTITENFNAIISDRIQASSNFKGNNYKFISDIEEFVNFAKRDISLFTFIILCAESQNFRIAINSDGFTKSKLPEMIDIIYNVCKKNSNLCLLTEDELYRNAIEIIGKYKFYG